MRKSLLFSVLLLFLSWNVAYADNEPANNTADGTTDILTLGTPATGSIGTSSTDADDYYRITTTQDGTINLTVTFPTAMNVWIYLYDSNGTSNFSGSGYSNTGSATYSVAGLAAGTYYARIYTNAPTTTTYSLTGSLTPATVANDTEPNDTRATAQTLAVNGSATGHIAYRKNGGDIDGYDYFKIVTTQDGDLTLTLDKTAGYATIVLYDSDGDLTSTGANLGQTAGPGSSLTFTREGLAAGTYYALVFRNYWEHIDYTLTNSFTPATVANDTEPNDTRATAQTLAVNGSATGHIAYRKNGGSIEDADYFKIVTTQDGDLTLTLDKTAGGSVQLYLYDSDGDLTTTGSILVQTIGNAATLSITKEGLAAGTYYALVFRNYWEHIDYTLTNSFTPATVANDTEPNDTRATAQTLAVNGSATGHIAYRKNGGDIESYDYFKIVTTQDGNLTLTLDKTAGYAGLYLYDSDGDLTTTGSTLASAASSDASIEITGEGLAAGTYYALVFRNYWEHIDYTLTNTLTPALYENDAEPNNTFATATLLNNNPNREGHIAYRYNGGGIDVADYYKIVMNTTGELNFDITFERAEYKALYLYNSAQGQIWTASGSQTTYNINQSNLAAGDYYFLVYRNYNTDYNSYTISNFEIPCNEDAAVITASGPTTFCEGGSLVLSTTETYDSYSWSGPGGGNTNSKTVTQSGNYQLTGVDYDGCPHVSNTINVTVNPNPAPVISVSGSTTFCNGGSVILTSNYATGNTWSTGATTQSITVTTSGSYTISVTNGNGCTGTSAATVVTVQSCNVWYEDSDGDGYGNPAVVLNQPTQPAGYVTDNTDCDDTDASVHSTFTFYADTDGDGYGSGPAVQLCVAAASPAPAGYSTNNLDCAPADVSIWRMGSFYVDADGDGYDAGMQTVCYGANTPAGYSTSTNGTDCNDANAAIHPGAAEICGNGIDENCNGMADDVCSNPDADGDGVPDATDCAPNDATKWQSANVYTDADGDGYTVGAIHSVCYGATLPAGVSLTSSGTDCDDSNSAVGSSIAAPAVNASTATAICAGSSATLTATPATGIQWQLNNGNISGATAATYAATQAGSYTAIRTVGTCTSPASNAITVTVNSAASNVALANSSDNNVNLVEDCTENGWTYYVNPAQPSRFLIGIEWGANTTARMNAMPQIGLLSSYTAAEQTSAPAKATYAMNRYWNVNNAGPLTAPINLRFFYAASEKTAVENAAANFAAANSAIEGTPAWFKTVGVPYTTSMVTPEGILNAILLMDMNTSGQTINGVLYAQFNGISSLSGGTYATTVGNASVLPILLNSFTGEKITENANRFNWSVVCTDNRSNKIELQRSHNSASFSTIHAVQTTVENCSSAFAYTDNSPLKGSNYYRLKLTDADGKISYSHVILLSNDVAGYITMSPNPVRNIAWLHIQSLKAARATVTVVDVVGKTVLRKGITLQAGLNKTELPVAGLSKGMYLVNIKQEDGSITTIKMVKE